MRSLKEVLGSVEYVDLSCTLKRLRSVVEVIHLKCTSASIKKNKCNEVSNEVWYKGGSSAHSNMQIS